MNFLLIWADNIVVVGALEGIIAVGSLEDIAVVTSLAAIADTSAATSSVVAL